MKFFKKRIIDDGQSDRPLMTRWIIFRFESFGMYIHKFHRSDHDRSLHDHPWPYVTIILKGGYSEVYFVRDREVVRRNYPGQILFRPATWRHRVVLEKDKTSWSLVLVGPRCRRWGFWPNNTWCWWRKYNYLKAICDEEVLWEGGED